MRIILQAVYDIRHKDYTTARNPTERKKDPCQILKEKNDQQRGNKSTAKWPLLMKKTHSESCSKLKLAARRSKLAIVYAVNYLTSTDRCGRRLHMTRDGITLHDIYP